MLQANMMGSVLAYKIFCEVLIDLQPNKGYNLSEKDYLTPLCEVYNLSGRFLTC